MQRGLVVLAVTCLCLVNGYSQSHQKTVDVVKQKAIFELYWHPDQPTVVSPELYQKSRSWSFEEHDGDYTDKAIVYDFIQLWKYGLLHKDAVFSVFHQEHLEEVIALFKLFYFAKDFETFYNTAVWARFNVNEKLFLYVFSVAIMHRPDTKNVVLPPFHEVFPHMFFNNEVIQAAYRAKMGDIVTKKSVGVKYQDGGDVIIHSNYSGWYLINNDHAEEKLSYFTEDVGLGFYYFTFSHDYPFWLSSEKYGFQKEIRGELYYYGHKQLLARYYLERLSNDLGEIESIDWHMPIISGYYPTIFHSNGLPYPSRPSYSHIPENKYELIHEIEELATRIHYFIDSGVTDEINFLGNFIEGNADFINSTFYGSFDHIARNILGYGLDPIDKNHIFPSALEYYSTSVRDPAFYRIHKKIFTYFLKYKKHLPKYTYNDIVFPGVKIESVAVDKLLTFFEKFDSIISNGVPVNSIQDAISSVIKVRQHRLNHKPFTYHITVNSDKDVKSIIRIFLGPKYDTYGHEIDFVKNWVNFVELDQWVVDLKTGTNKIERNSHESKYVAQDIPSIEVTWNKLKAAIEKGETYTYNDPVYGFPDRLVLPKGKKEGLPLKIFVYISHFDKEHSFHTESPVWGVDDVDIKPMGYPLDRPVFPYAFNVPNAFFKDVVVFHKNVDELNLTV